jgi:hypothetical protein
MNGGERLKKGKDGGSMEKLIRQLMQKHRLTEEQAREAIAMVSVFLKEKNPGLEKLIDHSLDQGADVEVKKS